VLQGHFSFFILHSSFPFLYVHNVYVMDSLLSPLEPSQVRHELQHLVAGLDGLAVELEGALRGD
jgi:hypothetical protein